MQQLKVEHKKIPTKTTDQRVVGSEHTEELVENKREDKGRSLALSRNVYRIQNSDIFYVESETSDNVYYFVRYNPSVFEWCSCMDNSTRGIKCKHIWGIERSIRLGTLKDIERLPAEVKRYTAIVNGATTTKSFRDDDYSF